MTDSLVSAVITTHNREPKMVLRAINSVISQTYDNIEIIVVNDSDKDYAYNDELKQKIEDSDKGIIYIKETFSSGACVARNCGLAAANGEYIGFLDDDDEWLPEKISKQVRAFSDDVAMVYCGSYKVDDSTGKKTSRHKKFYRGNIYKKLLDINFIGSTSFPLIRTECLKEIGGFDPAMKALQDFDVWLRLSRLYKADYIDEPLVIYHMHGGERISKSPAKKIAGLERLCEKNLDYLRSDKKLLWKRMILIPPFYALNGQTGLAIKKWFSAMKLQPQQVKSNAKIFLEIIGYSVMRFVNQRKES